MASGNFVTISPIKYSLKDGARRRLPPRRSAPGRRVAWSKGGSISTSTVARSRWGARFRLFFLKPTWKTLPAAVFVVCIAGALPAPPLALFVGWLLDIRWDEIFIRPEVLNRYAWLGGACEALCVYLFGVLPLEYFRPRLRRYPKSVIYATAFGGRSLAPR